MIARGSSRVRATCLAAFTILVACAPLAAAADKPVRGKPSDAPRQDLVPAYFQGSRVQVDGLTNEWADLAPIVLDTLTAGEHEYDWTGPTDLSAEVRVQHDDATLFVHVRVRDNAFKPPEKKHGGDTVDLWFDLGPGARDRFRKLRIDPTWIIGEQALEVTWDFPKSLRKTPTDTIQAAATRDDTDPQGGSYDLEVGIPFDALGEPGAPPIFEPLGFCVVVNDWDHDDKNEEQASVSSCPFEFANAKKHRADDLGRILFQTRDRIWRGIARKFADGGELVPQHSVLADLGGDARREEVAVAAGRLFVLGLGLGPGEWYAFDLGLAPDDRVLELATIDRGRDPALIALTIRRPWSAAGQTVEQDVVQLFRFEDGGGISDPLATIEVAQRLPDGSAEIVNTLDFGKGGRVTQKQGTASGWTAETWPGLSAPTADTQAPLLLPWDKARTVTHTLPLAP